MVGAKKGVWSWMASCFVHISQCDILLPWIISWASCFLWQFHSVGFLQPNVYDDNNIDEEEDNWVCVILSRGGSANYDIPHFCSTRAQRHPNTLVHSVQQTSEVVQCLLQIYKCKRCKLCTDFKHVKMTKMTNWKVVHYRVLFLYIVKNMWTKLNITRVQNCPDITNSLLYFCRLVCSVSLCNIILKNIITNLRNFEGKQLPIEEVLQLLFAQMHCTIHCTVAELCPVGLLTVSYISCTSLPEFHGCIWL